MNREGQSQKLLQEYTIKRSSNVCKIGINGKIYNKINKMKNIYEALSSKSESEAKIIITLVPAFVIVY